MYKVKNDTQYNKMCSVASYSQLKYAVAQHTKTSTSSHNLIASILISSLFCICKTPVTLLIHPLRDSLVLTHY